MTSPDPTNPTIRMSAASFALHGLSAMRACGISFNPYLSMSGSLNPAQNATLEKFVTACIELGMIPDLRRGWSYPEVLPRVLEMHKVPLDARREFVEAFRDALKMMLGKDEFLGDHWD